MSQTIETMTSNLPVDDVIDASDEEDDDEVASDIQELENQELLEEQKIDEVNILSF